MTATDLLEEIGKYDSTSKDDDWSSHSAVGSSLVKNHTAFDPRDYEHPKLSALAKAQGYVEVKDVHGRLRVRARA